MLTALVKDGVVVLSQFARRPMVYLDHWAFKNFSEDAALRQRFTTALRAREGTLALSWLNLGEYAMVADVSQRRAAEQFVNGILPSVFCLQVDLHSVRARERARHALPHADDGVASLLMNTSRPDLSILTATGLFEVVHHPHVAEGMDKLAEKVRAHLVSLRQTYNEDAALRNAVKCSAHPDAIQATTRTVAIVRELAATRFPDLTRTITLNDAIDFLHAAIPSVYCDMVLLDGAAEDMVDRARRKLKDTSIEMAAVYSDRHNGVERFLRRLEGESE